MNIKKIEDKDKWEKFILDHKYNSPFLSWSWGEFENEMGNKFERFGVFREDKLIGAIPVKLVTAKRGKYLHIRHGPVFDFENNETWTQFFKFITKKANDEECWFVRMSPLIEQDKELKYVHIFSKLKDSAMHNVDAEITWVKDLEKPDEKLLAEMRKNTRYYVRRAKRDGVEVIQADSKMHFEQFWKIYSDTVERQDWEAYSKDYIRKEWEIFSKNDEAEMLLAKYKDKFIAAAIILFYGDQAVYHHSGSLTKYRKIPASYRIQWEAIKLAKKRGKKWYNFWGISPLVMEDGEFKAQAGHPWEGLTFFKLGFGGQVREFVHAKDLPVSKKYFLTRMYDKFETWRRGY